MFKCSNVQMFKCSNEKPFHFVQFFEHFQLLNFFYQMYLLSAR